MVLSLAPKKYSSGVLKESSTAGRTIEKAISIKNALVRILLAFSLLPLPSSMAARGAPPLPANEAKADTISSIGMHSPSPVSAIAPTSGI